MAINHSPKHDLLSAPSAGGIWLPLAPLAKPVGITRLNGANVTAMPSKAGGTAVGVEVGAAVAGTGVAVAGRGVMEGRTGIGVGGTAVGVPACKGSPQAAVARMQMERIK